MGAAERGLAVCLDRRILNEAFYMLLHKLGILHYYHKRHYCYNAASLALCFLIFVGVFSINTGCILNLFESNNVFPDSPFMH